MARDEILTLLVRQARRLWADLVGLMMRKDRVLMEASALGAALTDEAWDGYAARLDRLEDDMAGIESELDRLEPEIRSRTAAERRTRTR